MVTDIFNLVGYRHNPGSSTTGIIFNDRSPFSLSWAPSHDLEEAPFLCPEGGRPETLIACSSSRGLTAFHDTNTNLYYVGNPLFTGPNAYTVLPPPPRPHRPHKNTHVVLLTVPQHSCFHLICATHDADPSNYTFDIYTSSNNEGHVQWQLYEHTNLLGYEIKSNSGVSWGRFACWLTETPGMVLMFEIDKKFVVIFKGPRAESAVLDHPETRLQLGRVGEKLGLVLVSGTARSVELHTMSHDSSETLSIDSIEIEDDGSVNMMYNDDTVQVLEDDDEGHMHRSAAIMDWDFKVGQYLGCTKLPRPVRFESYKMEVPLWGAGQLMLWQQKDGDDLKMRRIVLLCGDAEFCMTNGFAHVCTSSIPGHSPLLTNVDDEGGQETDENQSESSVASNS